MHLLKAPRKSAVDDVEGEMPEKPMEGIFESDKAKLRQLVQPLAFLATPLSVGLCGGLQTAFTLRRPNRPRGEASER